MPLRVQMIRAVNVGGTARLPMAELRALAEELGATQVGTYIASGNLICTPPGSPDSFDRTLESEIRSRYGYFREVISRSFEELRAAVTAHPFEVIEPKHSYVTFLTTAPDAAAVDAAAAFETRGDQWRVVGRDQHIRYADGAGSPRMNAAAIGRALGVPGTARNLLTVRRLADLSA